MHTTTSSSTGRTSQSAAGCGAGSPLRNWALILIAVCVLLLGACAKKEEAEVEAPAPVQTTAVTQDTIRLLVIGDGILYPQDQASVAPKIAAPVQKFYVNRGDHVKAGDLLATLENRDLTAAVAESKGGLDQAESNFRSTQGASVPEALVKAKADVDAAGPAAEAAKSVLDSREQLFKEGALARRQVDEARVAWLQANSQLLAAQEHLRALQAVAKDEQIKTATAQVDSAKGHQQAIEAQLSYSRILSPISGVISDRPLYAGELANPGAPLITVMDISRVVARVNVPQAQAHLVKVGQPAIVIQTDSGQQVEGKVIVVSPATDPNSTTVQVWVQAENAGEKLKPGAAVHAQIVTEIAKAATVVPVAAILPGETGGTSVFTVTADLVAHRRSVQLGMREGGKVQILSGVAPGEDVVVVGGMGLDDKAKVKKIDTQGSEVEEDDEEDVAPAAPAAGKDQKNNEAKPNAK